MTTAPLDITYASIDQQTIFHDPSRYLVVRAGRRWGKTEGAANALMEFGAQTPMKILWVDVTQKNIDRYFDEKFLPILRDFKIDNKPLWKWNRQKKILKLKHFNKGVETQVDFGSAEAPESLEGFGYDLIVCNEAGIIFKGEQGERLWRNSMRAMIMEPREDGKDARAWFIGTPKGLGLFEEFSRRGRSEDSNWKDWKEYHRVSADRKDIKPEEIAELIKEFGGAQSQAYRQEILAEFLGQDEGEAVIPYEYAEEALIRKIARDSSFKIIWGVDPAGYGADPASLSKRQGQTQIEPVSLNDAKLNSETGALWIHNEYHNTEEEDRPNVIIVDSSAIGDGWVTHMRSMGLPVRGINWAMSSSNKDKFQRMRDELWWKAREWMKTGSLAGDYQLRDELVKPLLMPQWRAKNIIKVESKVDMQKRYAGQGLRKLGLSPNRADAFVLTFAAGDERRLSISRDAYRNKNKRRGTWMAA